MMIHSYFSQLVSLWLLYVGLEPVSGFSLGHSRSPFALGRVLQGLDSNRVLIGGPIFLAKSHPEFSVVGEEDDSQPTEITGRDLSIVAPVEPSVPAASESTQEKSNKQNQDYGALAPGTVVQVQIGDLALARKAWKKRRRTGSPLLVPCSVLNVDRQSMVRWNLIYLLEKFGRSRSDGIVITAPEMAKHYRGFLKSSLLHQSLALGFESNNDMIVALFNKKVEDSYGVRLDQQVRGEETTISLKAPISRLKAHKRAAKAPLLQFRDHRKGDHGDADGALTHTGYVRAREESSDEERPYQFFPLSAALRVSQDDVNTGRIEPGSIHPAVVFDYDVAGDGGSPLLTLSLNPGGAREALKVKPDRKYLPIVDPRHMLEELEVGDGPFNAKVVRLMFEKALVDCEVGRNVASDGMVKVFGSLKFKDSLEIDTDEGNEDFDMDFDDEDGTEEVIDDLLDLYEDDVDENDGDEDDGLEEDLLSLREASSFEEGTFEEGEIVEDITDMFVQNEDGSLSYSDPETGETIVIDSDDDDFAEMMNVKKEIDSRVPKSEPKSKPRKEKTPVASKHAELSLSQPSFKSKRLRVGDDVKVYIRSVSKQSSQYTVTTNPAVQGRKAKDLKQEAEAQKRLQRLEKKLGGSLERIYALEGQECDGTVRATSQTGDWIYVQPNLEGLPVGVAVMTDDAEKLAPGDKVRVKLGGIDAQRGQILMQVMGKQ